MNNNKQLIFLHLPKNAGTTLYQVLDRFYGPQNIFTVSWQGETGNIDKLYALNETDKDKIKLLRGHFDYGIHEKLNKEVEYFTFLRKSEDRMQSFYSYVKRRPENRLYKTIHKNNMSFESFILLNDKDGNNGQIRKLSGLDTDETTMLETTKKNIEKHFPVVGLQEYFDESLLVLAHKYNWSLPFYIKQNVSKKKTRIAQKDKILIQQNNKGDIELYQFIESRLKKQMGEIPFFKLKLFRLKLTNLIISNSIALRVFKTRKLLKLDKPSW